MQSAEPLERGVYEAPWKGTKGEKILVAVDSHGVRRLEMVVFPGVDPQPAEEMLWQILNREDPPAAHLQIVA